jgi:hypothetical protein
MEGLKQMEYGHLLVVPVINPVTYHEPARL